MEDTFVKLYQEGLSIREISKRSLSVVGRKCSTDFISKILNQKVFSLEHVRKK